MATGQYRPIEPFSGDIYERGTVSIGEKATQTFKRGALLVFNGGYVEEAGAAPATVSFIAAEDGHNGVADGTYDCICYKITASDLWTFSLKDARTVGDRGNNYGLVKDASGAWYLDSADANDQVEVLVGDNTPELGAIGDAKARVVGRFQVANIALY